MVPWGGRQKGIADGLIGNGASWARLRPPICKLWAL